MKKHFRLSDYSITFSTRTRADEIAVTLCEFMKTLHDDDNLVIDFQGVEAISYSFLDQFLSRVSRFPLIREKRISIAGWSKDLISVIDKSLQHRSCDYSQSGLNREQTLVYQSN